MQAKTHFWSGSSLGLCNLQNKRWLWHSSTGLQPDLSLFSSPVITQGTGRTCGQLVSFHFWASTLLLSHKCSSLSPTWCKPSHLWSSNPNTTSSFSPPQSSLLKTLPPPLLTLPTVSTCALQALSHRRIMLGKHLLGEWMNCYHTTAMHGDNTQDQETDRRGTADRKPCGNAACHGRL
jgi:hypothetical protein